MDTFDVFFTSPAGEKMTGNVKRISNEDYEVFIPEKEVIIHCTKDENGILSCRLSSKKNLPWIDGISQKLSEELERTKK